MTLATGLSQNRFASTPRLALQSLQHSAAAWSAALFGDTLTARRGGKFGILMYHRVSDPVAGHPVPTWNVTPDRLWSQLSGLLARGFQAWPLRKVLDYRRRRLPLPPRVFVVTFDDGYENNLTRAFPILHELNLPATIFLATAYIGSSDPLPSDDWSAKGVAGVPADMWRALSIDQCRELQASGLVELGAHTHTHQDFRGRPDDFRIDLRECLAFLREQFCLSDATFAFPYGTKRLGFSGPPMARVAREVGMLCSLTTEWELASLGGDPYDWGRFQVEQHDTAATIAGKLSGWYGALRASGRALWSLLSSRRQGSSLSATSRTAAPLRLGRFR